MEIASNRYPHDVHPPTLATPFHSKGEITVRYSFAWTPAVLVIGTLALISIPFLPLIALLGILVAAIAAVFALVRASVLAVYRLARRLVGEPGGSRGETAAGPQDVTRPRPADDPAGLAFGPYAGTR